VGKLSDKTAIIVGATSGMGRATALLFAREGARVVIAGRRAALLQEVGEQIAAETGAAALAIPCDVTEREQIASLLDLSRAHLGKIDSLIYASGMNIPDRSFQRLTPATWDTMLATNLTGAFHCTQLALPIFREQQDGLLVYLSSLATRVADVSGPAYKAAKCGLDGLASAITGEEKGNGVRASIIYPGLCDTPLVLQRPVVTPPEVMQHALLPEDVAEACLFIAALPPRCHVPELLLYPSRL
jgi:NAD(P)-dependent dehydrogenase (short-subunit alcohol dehydrogenase family)